MNFNFDNFDPEYNGFDPDADNMDGAAANVVRQTTKAYFDLTFKNQSEHVQYVELFSALNSFTFARRKDLVSTDAPLYTLHPLGSREGNEAQINNIVPVGNRTPANEATADFGYVGFNENGDLLITASGAGAAGPVGFVTVSCKQTPYRGLFESSKINPFRLTRIRMSVTTDAQIDNAITHFTQNFLGAKSSNDVNPRNFFSPTQFQGKIIDIPVNFKIDGNRGITYALQASETVTWNCELEQYNFLTVNSSRNQ